ncbi:GntR family transcriptional regulator [Psychrobacillus lasiicapitis]|uniref:GntR family transcriptional regulator n=1 Tax=Psychrobacillus lasiicapitis TaxID=1636719 RepID=A0A544TGN6_9BACI|nr:GntR family transcriptional regulator [Psychrobacillus lasiicapitis]TQR16624.1 GntR family transcriptional regulator [Psychrobacillus lasiicapitis]GGA28594.1 GntR family transcriptional regulator [Psychrobacillus lasiicapitis]
MPLPNKTLEKNYKGKTSSSVIFYTVKRWIVTGQLKPNEKLDDMEFANYFSVSRTPIRDAFKLLESKNLIISSQGRGTAVTDLQLNNVKDIYIPLIGLQNLVFTNELIEFENEELNKLKFINDEFEKSIHKKDTSNILALDYKFHKFLIKQCKNSYIIEFCDTLFDHAYRLEYLFFSNTLDLSESHSEHNEIIKALERKDMYSASILVKKHWERTVHVLNTVIAKQNRLL